MLVAGVCVHKSLRRPRALLREPFKTVGQLRTCLALVRELSEENALADSVIRFPLSCCARGRQRPVNFSNCSGYRAPCTVICAAARSTSRRSSAGSSMAVATLSIHRWFVHRITLGPVVAAEALEQEVADETERRDEEESCPRKLSVVLERAPDPTGQVVEALHHFPCWEEYTDFQRVSITSMV